MGGDHKCPVCQATFTRPQHVARHMRSHTGDRPYKCQYCGDQFARSDLLSRHVNKCHTNEKPLPASGSRRKGSASASRATTSKQACDQCVQSSLPCDGCNPCAKCIQRKCRCTFVKFHRQTAPTGPGHHPQPSISSVPSTSSSSSRLGLYSAGQRQGANDDFLLGPAPHVPASSHGHAPASMADNLYSDSFSFGPLYAGQSPTLAMGEGGDFSSRYRAQAEALRRVGEGMHQQQPQYSDPRTAPAPWAGWDQGRFPEGGMHDKELQHFMASQNNTNPPSGTAPTDSYPPSASFLIDRRRPSLDFSSDGSSSIPSSAASSSAHLPMETIPMHQTFPNSVLSDGSFVSSTRNQPHQHQPNSTNPDNSSTRTSYTTGATGEGGFSSAFGLMSLDDPAVLAGLSSDSAPFFSQNGMAMESDPNATPMPMPPPHQQTQQRHQGPPSFPTPSKDLDTRELREFWKQYMRTPLSGPGPSALGAGSPSQQPDVNVGPGAPGYRRPRVASLPSAKTPTALPDRFLYGAPSFAGEYGQQQQGFSPLKKHPSTTTLNHNNTHYPSRHAADLGQPPPPQRQTLHGSADDLRSYEAAVLARKGPVTLSLKPPKGRRGTEPRPGTAGSSTSAGSGPSPQMAPAAFSGGAAGVGGGGGYGAMHHGRPGSAQSQGSSSLANVFGRPPSAPAHPHAQGPGPGMRVSFAPGTEYQAARPGYGSGSASPDVVSRESSVAVSDGSGGTDGSGADGGGDGGLRPSFKRLPSQTLGPANTKRALVMRGGMDEGEGVGVGVRAGGGAEGGSESSGVVGGGGAGGNSGIGIAPALAPLRKDERPVVNLAERRRRMSAPTTSEGPPAFTLGLGALP
ncbi:hypothetical protein FPV67DRAFT_1778694 [Lyophyllum atratum]|nr:hypothetical protein FPV67DRAFT_1778694 [Lyophyllum atratum]